MVDLNAESEKWGVEPGYHDVFGAWHPTQPETLNRLVRALSLPSGGPVVPSQSLEMPVQVKRAFQGNSRAGWVLAVQLYALRSAHSWGHGDFGDLARLIALAASRGAAGVVLNPLHALFPHRAENASPYAPNSRRYFNILYIDVEAIPEFPDAHGESVETDLAALRATEMVVYSRAASIKLRGLRLAYQGFKTAGSRDRRADFEAYRREEGDALLRFACFEYLSGRYAPEPWQKWPESWRQPGREELLVLRQTHLDECEFYEFTQWVADRQLGACQESARKHGMPIGLVIDLAVGIDPQGADAWSAQRTVLADVSIGAPPDEFNPAGQDWGLAPFNPHSVAADDFAPMRALLGATMRHAGAIRIDHVLGLCRLFMIPHGLGAGGGAYVRFPFEELVRVVAEESNRFRCIVIGEDLGTVPGGFREKLSDWGLWTYRVMLFEREHNGEFRRPEGYPAEALATFNTHDLPTFRGWMESNDLRVKRSIGVDPGETDEQRRASKDALCRILSNCAPAYSPEDFAAVCAFLAATPSRLVAISLDDVLGVTEQINVPGTVDQHPNWRRKLPVTIEDLESHEGLLQIGRIFAAAGRGING